MIKRIWTFTFKWLSLYNRINQKNDNEEAINMTTKYVKKIHNIDLPPHQLRELGLEKDWQKNITDQYIEKVVKTAERFKKDLKELSKR
jgi:hypothetical protein